MSLFIYNKSGIFILFFLVAVTQNCFLVYIFRTNKTGSAMLVHLSSLDDLEFLHPIQQYFTHSRQWDGNHERGSSTEPSQGLKTVFHSFKTMGWQ